LRIPQKENLQEQKWRMAISDEWVDKLLQYDYVSSKKGRGMSSLLISGARNKKRNRSEMELSQQLDVRSAG